MKKNDISELNSECMPRAVIAALELPDTKDLEHRLDEMTALTEACDIEAVCSLVQKLPHPEAGTYLGKGKIEELKELLKAVEADLCIFEGNLSPAQLKNLSDLLEMKIWDRTQLILEIFSRRAKTKEARLQVESAYLQYMLPRLSGMWQHLGRQAGSSGSMSSRGEGETQLEMDRRMIKKRIADLNRELDSISKIRSNQRQGRTRDELPQVALVGYTNAGKSTILNSFLENCRAEEDKHVFQKDMLFATLDTSVRRIKTEDHKDFLLSDTVGFIENLPHALIKAFRSTLEEAVSADLILVVLDASDPYYLQHKKVTEDTLRELGAENIPRIYVMNKADLLPDISNHIPKVKEEEIWISAEKNIGINELQSMIIDQIYGSNKIISALIPYDKGNLLNILHNKTRLIKEEYTAEGIMVEADCPVQIKGILEQYIIRD